MSNNYNPHQYPYPYPYSGRPTIVDKGLGFAAFITLMISTGLMALYYLGIQIFAPCNVPGGTFEGGWYGCNNANGDAAMFGFALLALPYVYIILPVVGILGIVAIVKNQGKKWGEWTIGLIAVGISVLPLLYLFLKGDIQLIH